MLIILLFNICTQFTIFRVLMDLVQISEILVMTIIMKSQMIMFLEML
jgi:hypothetical protein